MPTWSEQDDRKLLAEFLRWLVERPTVISVERDVEGIHLTPEGRKQAIDEFMKRREIQ